YILEHLADVFERFDSVAHSLDQKGRARNRRGRPGAERVSVRGSGGERTEAQRPAGAVAIDHRDALAEMPGHRGGNRATDDVDAAARRVGDDHFDLPRRPRLGAGIESVEWDRNNQAKPRRAFHDASPRASSSRARQFAWAEPMPATHVLRGRSDLSEAAAVAGRRL